MTNMAAKIQIKNDRINSFEGIFFIINQFHSSSLTALANKTLETSWINKIFLFQCNWKSHARL